MKTYRARIDEIDAALIKRLEERFEVVKAIGAYKEANGLPIYDAAREEAKIAHIREGAASKESADALEAIFREVMAQSRHLEE